MRKDKPMILTTITSSSVKEHNLLAPLTRLLIENLTPAPHGRLDINIATNDTVFVELLLLVLRSWTGERVVQKFQDAAPDVRPASEGIL